MTSFGWKRKIAITKSSEDKAFQEAEQVKEPELDATFDWILEAKKCKVEALEDNHIRFERLKQEGSLLAEEDRFWEAISRWNEALCIDSTNVSVLDMKAQALLQLHEWIPAIQTCQLAIQTKKNWWPIYQTLGRAQLGLGEVYLALRNFQIAFHLKPSEEELWTEDILWAKHLIDQSDIVARSRQEEGEATLRIKPECFHVNSVTATSQPELEHTVKSELHSVTLRR